MGVPWLSVCEEDLHPPLDTDLDHDENDLDTDHDDDPDTENDHDHDTDADPDFDRGVLVFPAKITIITGFLVRGD